MRAHPGIIGENSLGRFLPDTFRQWAALFKQIPDEGVVVAGNPDIEMMLRYIPGWHNLALLELFGLITIQQGLPEPSEGWRIELVQRAPLGDTLLAMLQEFFDFDNIFRFAVERDIPVGIMQPVLQPCFPEWKNTLSVPEWGFREGTYFFKVSLGKVWWRTIAIPANQTLDKLASTILDAVKFGDRDHLYRFVYQDRFGSWEKINHPHMDDGPWTSDVLIGDVPLKIGQAMVYLFDFGDNWEFDVTLERIDPDKAMKKPIIFEGHGAPPKQYPEWDK